jgi:alkylation response protein AidB-like acyl-CoA dehydrogenase
VEAVSDALEKAEAAAREAAVDTAAVQIALAAVELAKAAAAQQQPAPQPCQHHHKQRRSAGEWLGIACAVCVGGVGIAFASLALAILGGVAAIVVLVLRDMWRDMQRKGR